MDPNIMRSLITGHISMKYFVCISVPMAILLQCIGKITALDYLCYIGYHHCSGSQWCCPNGYVCTGTQLCLTVGAIIGIVIGVLFGVGIVIAIIVICCRRGRSSSRGTRLQAQSGVVIMPPEQQGYHQTGYSQAAYPQTGYPMAAFPPTGYQQESLPLKS
ncbi:uncharacterized protein LOC127737305 [Mytilus californianus]|uniref:uncharacterized protein LOC127737305 n=1 Tax=Mytilus californianus TaxID=6549 RepID=UPI002246B9F4|nr:uncharacterized protein LOC127737305 [Mytilus californianus]